MDFLELDPLLREALREDIGRGDVTTRAVLQGRSLEAHAEVIAKQPLVLAGWPVFLRVFQLLGEVSSSSEAREAEVLQPGTIGRLRASAEVLLGGERVALNLLQRMCGIATQTRRLVERLGATGVHLLDTRKTTPLWRSLEKYAVRMGGGKNHRQGLDDAILIKENHIQMAGGVAEAIEACRRHASHLHRVEVEVRDLEELQAALEARADVVLLDNFSSQMAREAVERVGGACPLEASGGISEANLIEYAETGVDFISMGALTHSVKAADISLIIHPESKTS